MFRKSLLPLSSWYEYSLLWDYSDPENGNSKLIRNVGNYLSIGKALCPTTTQRLTKVCERKIVLKLFQQLTGIQYIYGPVEAKTDDASMPVAAAPLNHYLILS
jgi:hypothetical protein